LQCRKITAGPKTDALKFERGRSAFNDGIFAVHVEFLRAHLNVLETKYLKIDASPKISASLAGAMLSEFDVVFSHCSCFGATAAPVQQRKVVEAYI